MCKQYLVQTNGIALCCVFLLNSGWTFCICGETKRQYRQTLERDRDHNCPNYNKKVVQRKYKSRECCQGLSSIVSRYVSVSAVFTNIEGHFDVRNMYSVQ